MQGTVPMWQTLHIRWQQVAPQSLAVICSHIHHNPWTQRNRRETLASSHNQQQTQTRKARGCDSILICYSTRKGTFSLMLRYSSFKILTNLGSQALEAGISTTKKMNDWFALHRCCHSVHEVKNKQDSKRMQRNIFQHEQQNAVLNECWLVSMPMSPQRNSFRRKENLHIGKPLLCTHCIYCSYRHFQQHER